MKARARHFVFRQVNSCLTAAFVAAGATAANIGWTFPAGFCRPRPIGTASSTAWHASGLMTVA